MNKSNTQDKELVEEVIDIAYYWRILMRKKWFILLFSIIVCVTTIFFVSNVKSIYRASTTILIESDSGNVIGLNDNTSNSVFNNKKFLGTELEILGSRELSSQLVRRMELYKNPLFLPNTNTFSIKNIFLKYTSNKEPKKSFTEEELFEFAVDKFVKGLSVSGIPDTQLVRINYDSYEAKLAATISDTLADVYIESHLQAKLDRTKKAADWLNGQLGDLRDNLKESEQKLQQYREESNLLDIKGVQTLDSSELSLLTNRYIEAKTKRYETETIYKQITSLGSNPDTSDLMGIPSILNDSLVQRFKATQVLNQQKVAELSNVLGPSHPDMLKANSELASSERSLRQQIDRVVTGIKANYRQAQDQENALNNQINRSKERFQDINRKEFKLRELEREADTNRQLYDLFFNRSKETAQTSAIQSAHARIIDHASTPKIPISPKRKQIVILTFFISLLIGAGIIFLMDFLDNSVRTPEEIEQKLNVDVISKIPWDKSNNSKSVYQGFNSQQDQAFTESIRTLRTSFVFLSLDNPYKVTMIVSSAPNEGKSTIALNLAVSLGQMEKTLLIDADLRRPSLHSVFNIQPDTPGLTDFITGQIPLEHCVHKISEALDFIPAGSKLSNPLEILASNSAANAFEYFKKKYDRVIIDTAPINAVSDSIVLSKYTDCTLYVVKADETIFPLVAKGVKSLRKIDANIGGIILNGVDPKNELYYEGYNSSMSYT